MGEPIGGYQSSTSKEGHSPLRMRMAISRLCSTAIFTISLSCGKS